MNIKESRIFITGYMGSGKTTAGQALAQLVSLNFLDIDKTIEEEQQMNVNTIFMKYGEHSFRNYEGELLDKIVGGNTNAEGMKNVVVSCGGGIILDDDNRKILGNESVVFLDCAPDIMFERVKDNPNLPNAYMHIKDEAERRQIFTAQYEKRKSFYEEVTDITVRTDSITPADVAAQIKEKLNII